MLPWSQRLQKCYCNPYNFIEVDRKQLLTCFVICENKSMFSHFVSGKRFSYIKPQRMLAKNSHKWVLLAKTLNIYFFKEVGSIYNKGRKVH